MNSSPFMDKQIMDLSSSGGGGGNEFIDFIGNSDKKKEEILAGYDFQPIRSQNLDESTRVCNSADAKSNFTGLRNYGSMDSLEPAKVISEKGRSIRDEDIVFEIDQTMKKHADKLLHALEGVSTRLTQLETKTRHLESSVDDLKESVGHNYGNTDGKMRQLENILREVQTGVQFLKDKHEIVEAQVQLAKLQAPKVNHQSETHKTMGHSNALHQASSAPLQQSASAPQPSHQLPPPAVAPSSSVPTFPSPNASPPPSQLQSFPPQVQFQNQFPQNQILPIAQQDTYLPPYGQAQDASNQQYQLPQKQQTQVPPSSAPHQQYQPASLSLYLQPPQQPQQHPSMTPGNPPPPNQTQHLSSHHLEETPYMPSQNYPPSLHQPPSHPPSSAPPSQQFYGPPSHTYEPPLGRSSSGYSSAYGPPNGPSEQFPYSGSPQYGGSSTMKPQQPSSSSMSHGGGSGYPQLPTARILPQALPAASDVSSGSGSGGTGNRVPIDDVVDKVTSMGFPRDHVRATVRRLTENGQSVDLNVVLDKLMNG